MFYIYKNFSVKLCTLYVIVFTSSQVLINIFYLFSEQHCYWFFFLNTLCLHFTYTITKRFSSQRFAFCFFPAIFRISLRLTTFKKKRNFKPMQIYILGTRNKHIAAFSPFSCVICAFFVTPCCRHLSCQKHCFPVFIIYPLVLFHSIIDKNYQFSQYIFISTMVIIRIFNLQLLSIHIIICDLSTK